MTTAATENLVLRTFYVPLEMDRTLKALAFTRGISKGELIRELIGKGLAAIADAGERSVAERLAARRAAAGSPAKPVRRRTTNELVAAD